MMFWKRSIFGQKSGPGGRFWGSEWPFGHLAMSSMFRDDAIGGIFRISKEQKREEAISEE